MEMLITQALDERDLLKKKIHDALSGTKFISAKQIRRNKDIDNADPEKVTADILATYQSINDMITRYYQIIQKIAESNAKTYITVGGKDITISAAISILKDISTVSYMKYELQTKLEKDYRAISNYVTQQNKNVDNNKQVLLNNLVQRYSDSKVPTQEDTDMVNRTVEEDYFDYIDPLDILTKIKNLKDENTTIKSEILSAIKISNARTTIEI